MNREAFDARVNNFLEKCRPTMQKLVTNANHLPSLLPSWKPGPSADKDLAAHISTLHIPTGSDRAPSLLLHDLGEVKGGMDKERMARIPQIFSFGSHMCVIHLSVYVLPINDTLPGCSSTPLDPAKPDSSLMACAIGGASILLQSQISLV